ncbi:MAG: hypothetical protein A3F73_11440 [Gallionellales bacterium RIFCSPLOWO2_12_FULL_59_22]|nr:MAG: hypothetical protein A3H99_12125 [Gallionellales bacterium RIFCSPLOWO2_02_FULL_59_110]OGT04456.1 MAG: hypothetical protein A2Z65_11935 [Gallionellales bacterium RIFCSPLOWO2_02_58_13]OGT14797.1 MAG: hypothetical protein A3F73_11440 [Gallionellales bacterium RIFCSPLOWO2_12_FULL_59_22]
MGILNVAPPRVVVGSLIGLIVFSVDAVATFIRFVLIPSVAERATAGSFLAMFPFLFLFIAAGALAGYLWAIRIMVLRFVSIGALIGAMVWSYLTVTWPLTARPTAIIPPQMSVLDAVFIGAVGGALGGLLLFVISGIRNLIHDHR